VKVAVARAQAQAPAHGKCSNCHDIVIMHQQNSEEAQ
jgi:hypothetical protein